jgi:hypothetical protein
MLSATWPQQLTGFLLWLVLVEIGLTLMLMGMRMGMIAGRLETKNSCVSGVDFDSPISLGTRGSLPKILRAIIPVIPKIGATSFVNCRRIAVEDKY